jgi:O-succinylhomoserine sulfhydrylase
MIPRRALPPGLRPETLAVREGLPASPWGEHSEALFLTSSFVHPSAEVAARRFGNEEEAFVYSRFGNPTVTMMERRLAALEGSQACVGTASGMAAILAADPGAAQGGRPCGVLAQRVRLDAQAVPGLRPFGVETSFVPQADVDAWRAAMRPTTRLLFAETPSNPLTEVCDIAALADVAHNARRAAGGRQLLLHPGTAAADRTRRRPRRALGHQVPRRPGAGDRRGGVRPQALVDEHLAPVMRSAG